MYSYNYSVDHTYVGSDLVLIVVERVTFVLHLEENLMCGSVNWWSPPGAHLGKSKARAVADFMSRCPGIRSPRSQQHLISQLDVEKKFIYVAARENLQSVLQSIIRPQCANFRFHSHQIVLIPCGHPQGCNQRHMPNLQKLSSEKGERLLPYGYLLVLWASLICYMISERLLDCSWSLRE